MMHAQKQKSQGPSAFPAGLPAATPAANALDPVIQQAYDQGRLAVGDVADFFSAGGVPLPDKPNPVVALYMQPPGGAIRMAPRVQQKQADDALEGKTILPMPQFEGGEHTAIGDQITLYFYPNQPGVKAYTCPLGLPNGLSLTYGQILALGGDFYGDPDRPISDGATPADRQARFTDSYNSLAVQPSSESEAMQILAVMKIEIDAVNKAIDAGLPASSAYKQLGDSLSEQWNRITGGGSIVSPWIPMGRYLKLAATNWDHFSQCAVLAYTAGHAVALLAAVAARSLSDPKQQQTALQRAYAMNAFADHFLTDLFSSGHMRSPRKQLNDTVTPASAGGLLTRYMHDEDSANGLFVSNQRGNQWKAYGDKRYFDMIDVSNSILVNGAAQLSADEIFQAFSTGNVIAPGQYAALTAIPDLAAIQNNQQPGLNYSPMFVATGNTVIRRNDLNNPVDFSWTNSWWGWSTLSWLKADYQGPSWQIGPMRSPTAAPAISPTGWQSTTPSPPDWVNGNQVRYCVSFVNGLNETNPGPWGPYTPLNGQFLPTLTGIPGDPTGTAKARNIYREFAGKPFRYVGTIPNNTDSVFIDRMP
jgi:hypothetical protein